MTFDEAAGDANIGAPYVTGAKKEATLKEGMVQGDYAVDYMIYSVPEIQRITKVACEAATKRSKKLTSIDKANVLESSKLWRKVVIDYVQKNYPQIQLNHMYVDK